MVTPALTSMRPAGLGDGHRRHARARERLVHVELLDGDRGLGLLRGHAEQGLVRVQLRLAHLRELADPSPFRAVGNSEETEEDWGELVLALWDPRPLTSFLAP